jgi:hypothetical protein
MHFIDEFSKATPIFRLIALPNIDIISKRAFYPFIEGVIGRDGMKHCDIPASLGHIVFG